MDNSYFIYSKDNLEIERFHLCSWEFKNGTALMEVGCEISAETLPKGLTVIEAEIHIPWLKSQNETTDLFSRLKDTANSKFIFNDSVVNTHSFDGGRGLLGILHEFRDREPLCILPVALTPKFDKRNINVKLDLSTYNNEGQGANLYFRFSITANIYSFSIRKKGVGRSTIIYDLKINEQRNLPDTLFGELQTKRLCTIKYCFFFNILPNSYDLTFFDSTSLKNVRTLEYDAFNNYLGDRRVQKDQLMVVFSKKEYPKSFAFFTIFTKERIGAGQFALAILINLVSGILLFLPAYRSQNGESIMSKIFWQHLPVEVYMAFSIGAALIAYFIWPTIATGIYTLKMALGLNKKNK
jgi:hypothetical protein